MTADAEKDKHSNSIQRNNIWKRKKNCAAMENISRQPI